MIHFTKEGKHVKPGLNLRRSKGGFTAIWAWYDPAMYEMTIRRLRVRLHRSPCVLWEFERFDIIQNYLEVRNLVIVHREFLEDLQAAEDQIRKTNEPLAYIKPQKT